MTPSIEKHGNDEVAPAKVYDHDLLPSQNAKEPGDDAEHAHILPLTEEELVIERKLRRKLDLMIMPLMIWTYLMNYIDR